MLGITMNSKDFVILPCLKPGSSVRFKAKTVRELQLEKMQFEADNRELEKKLQQLQSNMSREKEERKKSSAYRWKSGQAGPMTIQTQSKGSNNKISSGKAKLQILKEQIQEPVKEMFKHEKANAVAPEKSEVKGIACGLRKIKNALLTEANIHVGKLQVVDHFIKEVNINESKFNHKQKKELFSESACTGPENQKKGLLLKSTFNKEESAKSFQEGLLQWRTGNCDHREHLCAREVLSESVGICEVQTSLTVVKERIEIEFQKDGLSYMEKLLLKKYRRTPVYETSGSCTEDLKPVQTLSIHQSGTGGEEGGDDGNEDDDLTVEEVKRHWASVFREEVPNSISESAESSLKIEFFDDSYGKDSEQSFDRVVMEHGVRRMNKQRSPEPLEQCGRGWDECQVDNEEEILEDEQYSLAFQ